MVSGASIFLHNNKNLYNVGFYKTIFINNNYHHLPTPLYTHYTISRIGNILYVNIFQFNQFSYYIGMLYTKI